MTNQPQIIVEARLTEELKVTYKFNSDSDAILWAFRQQKLKPHLDWTVKRGIRILWYRKHLL
jgi:hypothetical protein